MSNRTTTRIKPRKKDVYADFIAPELMQMLHTRYGLTALSGTERAVSKMPELAASYGQPPVNPQTAFHMADEAAGMLRALQERVCSLADRLLGCEPQNASSTDNPTPSGTLNQLDAQAREAVRRITAANEALNRIEAALP